MLIEYRERRIYSSHHQFLIGEPESFDNLMLVSVKERKRSCQDRLIVAHGVLCVVAGSYGEVRVRIEIHDKPPVLTLAAWDHVTESPLDVNEGIVQVMNCLNEACDEFVLKRGRYRVRVCHSNLAGAVQSGQGADWYLLQLWPSRATTTQVRKRWAPKA